ncbi:MAG: cupin domain-containing protein [Sphingosinicella sp.]
MTIKVGSVLLAGLAAGCMQGEPVAQSSATPAAAATSEIVRAAATITGQPLAPLPQPYEVVVTRVVLPAGGVLPLHRHPWPRYALVEQGRIRVSYEGGATIEAGAGEAIVEAVDTWHEGVALEPLRLTVIDHVPPGRVNVERR